MPLGLTTGMANAAYAFGTMLAVQLSARLAGRRLLLGYTLLFFAVSELPGREATDLVVLAPLLAGVAMIAALVVHQYRARDPLVPVKRLAHTVPVAGILIAMAAGAAAVALVSIAELAAQGAGASPWHVGTLFWPELGAALLAAALFGAPLFTRRVAALRSSELPRVFALIELLRAVAAFDSPPLLLAARRRLLAARAPRS